MKIAITGGTGLVGTALGRALTSRGEETRIVSRSAGADRIVWTPTQGLQPADALSGCDAVVHLAGAGVADRRWNRTRKKEILESRRWTTQTVVEGLRHAEPRPKVLISASAVGFYGDSGSETRTEASAAGDDFLAQVCVAWEADAKPAASLGVRLVTARIGIVLSTEGGALARMQPAFKLGAGGPLGDGTQYMPWIHIDDLVAGLLHLLDDPEACGVYNLSAPAPVDNATFTAALGRTLSRPTLLRMPRFALRGMFGELADVLLAGQRAIPERLQRAGFAFRHPEIDGALADLLRL
ncbi:MAG: TIGR01777 family oxidoreductase [Nannocystaceae bacterium]|nr:TIGR01777 family oxidoreductase [Nannocystaceae bacterium]